MSPKLIFTILARRSIFIVLALMATLAGSGLVLWLVPPRYDGKTTATVDPAQADPITGTAMGIQSMRYQQGNLVALIQSRRVALDVVRRLGLSASPGFVAAYRKSEAVGHVDISDWIAAELLRSLDARFTEGTNVLTVTYKGSDPKLAAQLANAFMASFIDAAIDIKVSGAQQAAQWFEPQSDKLRGEVEELRERINTFRRQARLTPYGNSDPETTLLTQVSTELSGARAEALKIESLLALPFENEINPTAAQPFDSPLLQSLRVTLANTIAELSKATSELGQRNPKVQSLDATRKSLLLQIVAEIKTARSNLENKLESLKSQISFLEAARAEQVDRLIGIQGQRDRMTQLGRDLDVKQERFINTARTAAQAQLQGQLSFSNIAILDNATPPSSPAFPKPIFVIPAAIGLGLMMGLVLALIAESLDRRIRSVFDLEFATAVPSLGVLIAGPSAKPMLATAPGRARLGYQRS